MAATKGNQFWKLRNKHGRDKLFTTPQLLWEAAEEYFEWVESNPMKGSKPFAYMGEITVAEFPIMRAMTVSQLCFYLGCNEAYFRQFKLSLEKKTDETSKDFSTVINDIENIIYNQKFQGASGNLLNANIIARELGLADRTENKTELSGEVKTGFASEKQEEEFNEFMEKKYKFKK